MTWTPAHIVAFIIFIVSMVLWAYAIVGPAAPPNGWRGWVSLPAFVAVLCLAILALHF